jgi:hypothetical protein
MITDNMYPSMEYREKKRDSDEKHLIWKARLIKRGQYRDYVVKRLTQFDLRSNFARESGFARLAPFFLRRCYIIYTNI